MRTSKNFKIFLLKRARVGLNAIYRSDQSLFKRAQNALCAIQANPYEGKQLTRSLKGKLSYRVGDHRIVYKIERQTITIFVFTIGHRKNVYRQT
jgi:mRNA interferase RelE/StbE